MPAVENINGQAITLHNKHKGVKGPQDMKGFRFCVPFDYSMHNYLLRYYLAEGACTPTKTCRSASCRRRRWSPISRRTMSMAIWRPIPSTSARCMKTPGLSSYSRKRFGKDILVVCSLSPRSLQRPTRTPFRPSLNPSSTRPTLLPKPENRKAIAEAIAPKNYLNQPEMVVELDSDWKICRWTGEHQGRPGSDRLRSVSLALDGGVDSDPDETLEAGGLRVDYKKVAEQVYLAAECDKISNLNWGIRHTGKPTRLIP